MSESKIADYFEQMSSLFQFKIQMTLKILVIPNGKLQYNTQKGLGTSLQNFLYYPHLLHFAIDCQQFLILGRTLGNTTPSVHSLQHNQLSAGIIETLVSL